MRNPGYHSAHPQLSDPVILLPDYLTANPFLTEHITSSTNDAFRRSKLLEPKKWVEDSLSFPAPASLNDMLGNEGVMCIIYDENEDGPNINHGKGKVTTYVAAIPWSGGWFGEGKGVEKVGGLGLYLWTEMRSI